MEGAFKEFIHEHRKTKTTRLTLIQFDGQDDQQVVHLAAPIGSVDGLIIEPRGWTPLYDAFCKAIDSTGRRLSLMPEGDRPDKVLMIVVTDGAENSSKTYRASDVRERVSHQSGRYQWQFVYLGANQDAIEVAGRMGINWQNAMTYGHNSIETTNAVRSMTNTTMAYAAGLTGQSVNSFSTEDRLKSDKTFKTTTTPTGGTT